MIFYFYYILIYYQSSSQCALLRSYFSQGFSLSGFGIRYLNGILNALLHIPNGTRVRVCVYFHVCICILILQYFEADCTGFVLPVTSYFHLHLINKRNPKPTIDMKKNSVVSSKISWMSTREYKVNLLGYLAWKTNGMFFQIIIEIFTKPI